MHADSETYIVFATVCLRSVDLIAFYRNASKLKLKNFDIFTVSSFLSTKSLTGFLSFLVKLTYRLWSELSSFYSVEICSVFAFHNCQRSHFSKKILTLCSLNLEPTYKNVLLVGNIRI